MVIYIKAHLLHLYSGDNNAPSIRLSSHQTDFLTTTTNTIYFDADSSNELINEL